MESSSSSSSTSRHATKKNVIKVKCDPDEVSLLIKNVVGAGASNRAVKTSMRDKKIKEKGRKIKTENFPEKSESPTFPPPEAFKYEEAITLPENLEDAKAEIIRLNETLKQKDFEIIDLTEKNCELETLLASEADEDTQQLSEVKLKREAKEPEGMSKGPTSVVKRGTLLATEADEETQQVWDVNLKRQANEPEGMSKAPTSVVKRGTLLATEDEDTQRVWDVKVKRQANELERVPKASTAAAKRGVSNRKTPKGKRSLASMASADDALTILVKQQSDQFGIRWSKISDVLRKCRLISKTWKNSVDHFLEEDLAYMKLCSTNLQLVEYRQHYSPVSSFLSNENPEEEVERIQNFMNFYSSQRKLHPTYNPLPNQHLFIQCIREERNTDDIKVAQNWTIFSNAVEQYLQMFGKTVRAFTLIIDMPDIIMARKQTHLLPMYRSFCEWLHLLLELQSLALITCADYCTFTQKRKRLSLDELLTFPTLQKLVIFQSTQLSNFAHSIIKKNPQIRKLYLGDSTWPSDNLSALSSENINLPNLQECVLHIDRGAQKSVMEANWNLPKLAVCFHLEKVPDSILHVPFTSTVGDLTLEQKIVNESHNERLDEQVLEAPFVKHLTIRSPKWEDIDWHKLLAGVSLLETLNVEMSTERKGPRASYLDNERVFWGYMKTILHGTYWLFLPQLEIVNFNLRIKETDEPQLTLKQELDLEREGMSSLKFNITVKNAGPNYFSNFK